MKIEKLRGKILIEIKKRFHERYFDEPFLAAVEIVSTIKRIFCHGGIFAERIDAVSRGGFYYQIKCEVGFYTWSDRVNVEVVGLVGMYPVGYDMQAWRVDINTLNIKIFLD